MVQQNHYLMVYLNMFEFPICFLVFLDQNLKSSNLKSHTIFGLIFKLNSMKIMAFFKTIF